MTKSQEDLSPCRHSLGAVWRGGRCARHDPESGQRPDRQYRRFTIATGPRLARSFDVDTDRYGSGSSARAATRSRSSRAPAPIFRHAKRSPTSCVKDYSDGRELPEICGRSWNLKLSNRGSNRLARIEVFKYLSLNLEYFLAVRRARAGGARRWSDARRRRTASLGFASCTVVRPGPSPQFAATLPISIDRATARPRETTTQPLLEALACFPDGFWHRPRQSAHWDRLVWSWGLRH